MKLGYRAVMRGDIATICNFPQNAEELFYMFPKASFPLTEAQLLAVIEQRFNATVVTGNQVVIGFANFYRAEPSGVCCIGNVIVAPEARGHGAASCLVETMIGIADKHYTASEIRISCFNRNTAGLLLYKKLGFEPFDIEEPLSPLKERLALVHMRRIRPSLVHWVV